MWRQMGAPVEHSADEKNLCRGAAESHIENGKRPVLDEQ